MSTHLGGIMPDPVRLARIAGGLYLLMCVLGGAAHLVVRAGVRVPGDAAATAANVAAEPGLFRAALVADVVMATAFVLLGLVLHRLLAPVDRRAAGAMVLFVTVGAALILSALVFHLAAGLVATDPAYATASGRDGLVLLLVDLHHHGYVLAGVFFGLWLLPLGHLARRSGLFPPLLGLALIVAGGAWILHTLTVIGLPDRSLLHTVLSLPTFAELAMVAYLLVRGVRRPSTARPVPAGAGRSVQ
jgi:hypothetical protein